MPERVNSRKHLRRQPRGSVMVYMSVGMVVVCGFVSLAVDYGRVQVAKTELQSAADTAARYAASGVKHQINGVNAAQGMALANIAENKVDSKLLKDSQATAEVGIWNASTETFTLNNSATVANAVRITLRCQNSDSTAIPTGFASVIGFKQKSLIASAIALYDDSGSANGSTYQQKYVPATSNLWLAGNLAGTKASKNNPHNNPDTAGTTAAPLQSPVGMNGLRVTPGSTLKFDGVNGGANNDISSAVRYNGDGNLAQIVDNITADQNLEKGENGKSNITAPINSVIAVFLDDNEPKGSGPDPLDFSTAASRDFQTLRPELGQVFFIGDGRRANGDLQQFVIPKKATRVFIGTMDSYEWNNNVGGFTVTATAAAKIILVK